MFNHKFYLSIFMLKNIKSIPLYLFTLALSMFVYSGTAQAGGGVQLGLSDTYIVGAVYSLSTVEGEDIQQNEERGFVHSRLALHLESDNNATILDAFGQVGRFFLEDNRMSLAGGIRPIAGETKNGKAKKGDENHDKSFNVLNISVGVDLRLVSWLGEGLKLHSSVNYYISPQVVSFGDFQSTNILGLRAAIPIFATSELYLSYDNFAGTLKDNKGGDSVDIINTLSLGVRLGL